MNRLLLFRAQFIFAAHCVCSSPYNEESPRCLCTAGPTLLHRSPIVFVLLTLFHLFCKAIRIENVRRDIAETRKLVIKMISIRMPK